jgi:RNA 2'-phosphotransferase, Tpt1 / KptA family
MLNRTSFVFSALKTLSRSPTLSRTYIKHINDGRTPRMAASRSTEDFIDMADELDISDRGGKLGGRGNRAKSAGRGGGGSRGSRVEGSVGGEMNREVAVSKALSKLLRHAAVDVGLKLDSEGFARVDQVVSTFILIDPWAKGASIDSIFHVTCLPRARFPYRTSSNNFLDAMATPQVTTCHIRRHLHGHNRQCQTKIFHETKPCTESSS